MIRGKLEQLHQIVSAELLPFVQQPGQYIGGEINQQAQKFDGIEEIKEDGTIVFTQKSVDIMKKMLNYECKTLSLNECESRAHELLKLYRDFLITETKP